TLARTLRLGVGIGLGYLGTSDMVVSQTLNTRSRDDEASTVSTGVTLLGTLLVRSLGGMVMLSNRLVNRGDSMLGQMRREKELNGSHYFGHSDGALLSVRQ